MLSLTAAVASVRNSVVAVLRITRVPQSNSAKKKGKAPQFRVAIVGTAWCIVADRVFLTAQHVLNEGKPRDPNDHFYILTVPSNGKAIHHAPVTSFTLESQALDMALMEIGGAIAGVSIPQVSVTMKPQQDGSPVLTYGFPSPQIVGGNIDPNGNWLGGSMFLVGHANEGIVAASYPFNGAVAYELNVGWHHGESGGPIFALDPLAGFAVMQAYRNIQTPHGMVAGPHLGRALVNVQHELTKAGAQIV